MTLNIPNLNKLIAHLEAQPPERINMGWVDVKEYEGCGTCGCIKGHALLIGWNDVTDYFANWLGIDGYSEDYLTMPDGWRDEQDGVSRYPAHRVIATLKRLRDHYLATGKVVVDWGQEPSAGEPWSTPHAVETTKLSEPELPVEITRLLGDTVEA